MESISTHTRWLVLLTVIVGTFLGSLDQTVVGLAVPKIIDDFHITVSEASWIATAYILANAVFVPVWGKLGDTVGRKKIYLIGLAVFILGSILAAFSWNLGSLLAFRVVQAVAVSANYPTAMAIITVTFREGKERAQALGLWSASFSTAIVFGPLIGGPLIDNFGWRSIFLINLPVGIIGLVMAFALIKESISKRTSRRFDLLGAATLGMALAALVFVLQQGQKWGWLSEYSVLSYITIIVFGVVFYTIEVKHPEPVVDFKFFKIQAFTWSLINNVIIFMGMVGGIFLIPIFVQTYLGYNATQTGYLFIPMAIALMVASPLGASLTGKIQPRYVIAASTFIAAGGMYLFSIFLDTRSTPLDVIIPLSIFAFGMGFGMAQRTNIIASVVPQHEVGIASAILALARNIAGAFGIALFTTILNNTIESDILNIGRNTVIYTSDPAVYQQVAMLIVLKAQILSYKTVFYAGTLIVLIGALTSFFIRVKEVRKKTY